MRVAQDYLTIRITEPHDDDDLADGPIYDLHRGLRGQNRGEPVDLPRGTIDQQRGHGV